MSEPGRWPEADALLDRALALPPAERLAFVRAEVADDGELRAMVERVLREDDPRDGFLAPGGALTGPVADDLARDEEWGERTLERGVVVGPYRVDRQIGRGGMGEVYLARDLRLGRDVALKILPRRLAAEPERVVRFGREARALAAVSHPGVAAIYDVHEEAGLVALVLELVDGPTLAERIGVGPLPPDEATAIARRLVDAVAAAHERGIVHRDLKPANIKVRADGSVKVLDFGLARAIADEGPATPDRPDLSAITVVAPQPDARELRPGAVLGTSAYMSPEQARGQRVDHRTDIWAFGCVLFEMLAGQRAFNGDTTPDVVARVLEREPDYARLPPRTPRALERLMTRCLQKDVGQRLAHIGDARFDLDAAASELRAPEPPANAPPRSTKSLVLVGAGVVALLLAGAGLGYRTWRRQPPPAATTRLAVPLPPTQELVIGQLDAVALSAAGRTLVYRARENGVMRLFVRSLDQASAHAITGTDNVAGHAVSPDGRFVAFGRDGQLFKAALDSGTPVVVTAAPGGVSAAWAPDDTIVFAAPTTRGLQRVSASGGTAAPQTTIDPSRGDLTHTQPAVSPDGERIAFTIETAAKHLIAITGRDGADVRVVAEGRQPQFLSRDVLVFARETSVWALRLDAERRARVAEPVEVLSAVDRSALNGFVHFAVSPDGSIVYVPERPAAVRDALVWVDRRGREHTIELEARQIVRFALSRDGARLALAVSEPDNRDVWIYDRARRTLSRLTRDPAADTAPVWSPDRRFVAFRSDRDGGGLFIAAADGSGDARRLTHASGLFHTPYSFTPDGNRLLFVEFRDYRDQNIFAVTTQTSAPQVEPVLTGAAAETRPAISPNGRWMAYQSDESGRYEVYVRPFPEVARARWQVSTDGGASPIWRADGRELFFAGGSRLMSAAIAGTAALEPGVPQPLFAIDAGEDRLGAIFDASADGQRFLVRRAPPASTRTAPQLHVILNWKPALPGGRSE